MSEREPRGLHAIEEDLESARLVAELDETMANVWSPTPPSPESFQRLLAEVEQPPQRYAPFFARLAQLFDLSEDAVISECARLAQPNVWRFGGLPGIKHVRVNAGPGAEGAEVLFVRFAPGLRFPRHLHTGTEHVLVLEGSYRDSDGVAHHAGELVSSQPGTRHSFQIAPAEPCIAATVAFGREFEALPLKLLTRALRTLKKRRRL